MRLPAIAFLLSALIFASPSCSGLDTGQKEDPENVSGNNPENGGSQENNGNGNEGTPGKTLIVYYSYTGDCQKIVETLSGQVEADILRIQPADKTQKYEANNYAIGTQLLNAIKADPNSADSYPAIDPVTTNLDDYGRFIIVTPLWWSQMAAILQTYLFHNGSKMAGKPVSLIVSSHSSGISGVEADAKRLIPQGKFTGESLWINNTNRNNQAALIKEWLGKTQTEAAPTIKMNNGLYLPTVGIGTYSLHDETCFNSVYTALKNGVRLIDTAYMYDNEEQVGKAVRQAVVDGICKREDIKVITKIYPGEQFANPDKAIQERLDKLDIGYVDIMLLHHPGTNDVKAYKAMEKFHREGKILSLGISCFYIKELKEFLPQVSVKPVLVQNEIHPYYQDTEVVDYIHSQDIVVQAWYPLGGRGFQKELFSDPVLARIAKEYGKSLVQVILRWHYQRGVVAIPGSSNPAHIAENIDIFDFSLSDEEMADIAALNRNEKHDWY